MDERFVRAKNHDGLPSRRYGMDCVGSLELYAGAADPYTHLSRHDQSGCVQRFSRESAVSRKARGCRRAATGERRGADYLAAYVSERVSHNARHVIVSAGDLIGASPLVSAAYHDEATLEAMRLLGLEISSVGNHEFDAGPSELLRKQTGGCLPPPAYSCLGNNAFSGASFKYLAANVVVKATGKTLFPAYEVKSFIGARAQQVIGTIAAPLPSTVGPSGEELAADLVADSQLAATASPETGGAVMSFVNAGGVRYPGFNLPNVTYPHDVTYQEAFTVRPFGSSLITMALTAQQIKDVLEQQFAGCKGQTANNLLQVSVGVHVDWSSSAAPCQKVVNVTLLPPAKGATVDRIVINGTVPSPAKTYRVSIDTYLSAGKDHFTVFLQGQDIVGGPQDIDALVSYMKARYLSPQEPFDPKDPKFNIPRIRKIN